MLKVLYTCRFKPAESVLFKAFKCEKFHRESSKTETDRQKKGQTVRSSSICLLLMIKNKYYAFNGVEDAFEDTFQAPDQNEYTLSKCITTTAN